MKGALFFGSALVEDQTPRRRLITLLCLRRILGHHTYIGRMIWKHVQWLETQNPLEVVRSCCIELKVEYDFTHMWHVFTEGALLRGLWANGFTYDKRYRPVPHLKIIKLK